MWRAREVLYIFMYRDIVVQYKQAVLGLFWALLKPAISIVAFTIVFSRIANLESPDMAYPVLVLSGLVPWYFLSNSLSEMSNSLIGNQSMVSKIYFPRMLLPLSTLGVNLVDLLVSLTLLAVLLIIFGMGFSWTMLAIPLVIAYAMLVSLSAGLILSALNVQYRDVRIVIPFLLQLGLYISPIGYSTHVIPEQWRLIYSLNPVVGVIESFRWSISGGATDIYWPGLLASTGVVVVMSIIGFLYFRKVERSFADVI